MSKITIGGFTVSGTECFIAEALARTGIKGLNLCVFSRVKVTSLCTRCPAWPGVHTLMQRCARRGEHFQRLSSCSQYFIDSY